MQGQWWDAAAGHPVPGKPVYDRGARASAEPMKGVPGQQVSLVPVGRWTLMLQAPPVQQMTLMQMGLLWSRHTMQAVQTVSAGEEGQPQGKVVLEKAHKKGTRIAEGYEQWKDSLEDSFCLLLRGTDALGTAPPDIHRWGQRQGRHQPT